METVTGMPRRSGEWAVQDLDAIPDDGLSTSCSTGCCW